MGDFSDGPAGSKPFAPPTLSGERRQITALFYDIVDSTGLLQKLDPEDFARAQRVIHGQAAAAIRDQGGFLDRILGDGGCAYFGYPDATEDAAECAVAASLELVKRCHAISPTLGIDQPIRIRVGIATGPVILQRGDDEIPSAEEVIGLAPTLAARIQTEAEPDSIAVSDTTYRITRLAFAFEPLGPRALKGFVEEQQLWRPIARRPSRDRFSRQRRSELPLFARQDELDLCRGKWAQARNGAGQALFIWGEAGIGKSRLVAALREEIARGGAEIRLLQCEPRRENRPLHPLEDKLWREISEGHPDRSTLPERITDYLEREARGATEDARFLVTFLLQHSEKAAAGGFDSTASAETFQQVASGALDLVRAWCSKGPQLLIFEDLHWADALTLSFLDRLVAEMADLPLLVVTTSRNRRSIGIGEDPHVSAVALGRLDASTVSRFVETIWAPSAPPEGVSEFVFDRSGGVPLLIEETTRLLKDRFGDSSTGIAEWEAVLREEGVTTLHDFISARLAQLGPARRVAQIASVLGRDFSHDILAILTAIDAPGTMLDERLAELVDAGIVRPTGDDHHPFSFRHVLIQEAAYQSLLKSERRLFHDAIVQAVTKQAAAPLADDVMAWHCEQAGRLREAAQFAIRAAENCSIHSALHDAERLLTSAEDLLARSGADPRSDELVLKLLMVRGPVVTELFGSGSNEARSVYERGVAICRTRPSPDPEKWFPLYWGWWFTSADYGIHKERAQELVAFTERVANPEIRLQAFHCAWATDFNNGQHHNCLSRVEQGLALYDVERGRESRARYGGHDAKVCALAERGLSLWFLGHAKEAAASVEAALAWATEIGHVGSLCHALDMAVMLRRYEGDAEGAAHLVESMTRIADAQALTSIQAKAKIFGGWAQALDGSPREGLHTLEAGLARQQEIGTEEDFPVYLEMQAELLGLLDENDKGAALLDDAIERAERVGHLFWLPELYRRRAILRKAAGQSESLYLEDLSRAVAEAQSNGAVMLERRARADLASLRAA